MVNRCLLGMVVIVFMSTTVHGKVYEWVDDKGVTSFTDNRDKVPFKYRKQARELDVDTLVTSPGSSKPEPPVAESPPAAAVPILIGGRDENGWRSAFAALRGGLGSVVARLPEKRDRLAIIHRKRTLYHKASDRVASNDLSAEIEQDEASIREFQEKLSVLEAEANSLGVPQEWRDRVRK